MENLYDLAIVGAGLSALAFMHAGGAENGRTVVLEYQDLPGGWLRAARSSEAVPRYGSLVRTSAEARYRTTARRLYPAAHGWTIEARSDSGKSVIHAGKVLLACGGFEATREYAQIPGDRPAGVCTPIFVHQILDRGLLPGRRALVYGAAAVAVATAERLQDAGVDVLLVPPPGLTPPRTPATSLRVEPEAELIQVQGASRVEQVVLRRGSEALSVDVDTLVYANGLVPNTGWLRGSGIVLRPDGAVAVDEQAETSMPDVYAIGTVVEPSLDHETSEQSGKRAADAVWAKGVIVR